MVDNKININFIHDALKKHPTLTNRAIAGLHPSDIAGILARLPEKVRFELVASFDNKVIASVLPKLSEEVEPEKIFQSFNLKKQAHILCDLDYDDAAWLTAELTLEERETLLKIIDWDAAQNIRILLSYPENTAGRLMNTEVIRLNQSVNKNEALGEVIRQSEASNEVLKIYVVDDDNTLMGFITLRNLIVAQAESLVKDIMNVNVRYVYPHTDQEDVAKTMSEYDITSLAVADDQKKLLGFVAVDDVLDILEKESTEDILKMSGVTEFEEFKGSWVDGIRSRFPWLAINMFTAVFASYVIRSFESTLQSLVILSAYMTIVAGMGGNAATQALAVTVRRLSLREISRDEAVLLLKKEFLVGIGNGIMSGIVAFIFSVILDANYMLALVVFLAMSGNLIIATMTGTLVPLILKKIKIDPAIASSIIITTFTDVFGFILLLGLASQILL